MPWRALQNRQPKSTDLTEIAFFLKKKKTLCGRLDVVHASHVDSHVSDLSGTPFYTRCPSPWKKE